MLKLFYASTVGKIECIKDKIDQIHLDLQTPTFFLQLLQ